MSILITSRVGNFIGFAVCTGMMMFALFAQYVLDMEPCPLCIFQRVAVIAMGVLFIVAALHDPARIGSRIYATLLTLVSLAGLGVAGRHVWLQNLPKDQVPSCGPGLDFMLETFPIMEVLRNVLSGSGECAEVSWRFLGLTIPGWTLIAFLALAAYAIWVNWPVRRA